MKNSQNSQVFQTMSLKYSLLPKIHFLFNELFFITSKNNLFELKVQP